MTERCWKGKMKFLNESILEWIRLVKKYLSREWSMNIDAKGRNVEPLELGDEEGVVRPPMRKGIVGNVHSHLYKVRSEKDWGYSTVDIYGIIQEMLLADRYVPNPYYGFVITHAKITKTGESVYSVTKEQFTLLTEKDIYRRIPLGVQEMCKPTRYILKKHIKDWKNYGMGNELNVFTMFQVKRYLLEQGLLTQEHRIYNEKGMEIQY